MEAKRKVIIQLHSEGKTRPEILRALKTLNVNPMFIKRTIERYEETCSIKDKPRSGRPKSKRTRKVIKAVRERIARNPRRSLTKMAKDFNMGETTMRELIKKDLGMYPYKMKQQQLLSDKVKVKRLQRSKIILQKLKAGTAPNIIFSDEKLFTVEQAFNPQNDRVLAKRGEGSLNGINRVNRVQKPQSVMVWAAVTSTGKSPLIFVPSGVKINTREYISTILEDGLLF